LVKSTVASVAVLHGSLAVSTAFHVLIAVLTSGRTFVAPLSTVSAIGSVAQCCGSTCEPICWPRCS
jgi:hypothetical protein